MAWSTQQLARLANTTTNTVRHYHKVGLLDLPERGANGYKQYGVPYLLRLLQVKRLSDLGFTLAQVAEMGAPNRDPADDIRALDAELDASMERISGVRAQLASILEHGASADIPSGFAPVSGTISDAQRSLLAVYSIVFSEPALEDFGKAVATGADIDVEFEALPADADDATVASLSDRMVVEVRSQQHSFPDLTNAMKSSPHGAKAAKSTVAHALAAVYHPAQLRALKRVGEILDGRGD
jgi:DNA-binding transcriptional MerR regulator